MNSELLVVIALRAARSVRRHAATMCHGEVGVPWTDVNADLASPNNIQQLYFPEYFSYINTLKVNLC